MFDNLSSRFESILKKVRGKGRLTEADVDEVMGEIRAALLDADVNVSVARAVVARIREQAVGVEVSQALDPGQQVVKIVNQELTAMLGGETLKITYAGKPPTVVLMAGLQGSGKTTSAAKYDSHCWWEPTFSAPRRSSSCARSVAKSTCRCSPSPVIPSPQRHAVWPRHDASAKTC
jgi:signal recognition particle GTPase